MGGPRGPFHPVASFCWDSSCSTLNAFLDFKRMTQKPANWLHISPLWLHSSVMFKTSPQGKLDLEITLLSRARRLNCHGLHSLLTCTLIRLGTSLGLVPPLQALWVPGPLAVGLDCVPLAYFSSNAFQSWLCLVGSQR